MPLSIDPKPAAAFIEYTLKPLIDNYRELSVILKEQGIEIKHLRVAIWLFVLDRLIAFSTSIIVTGIICYTALRILPYTR